MKDRLLLATLWGTLALAGCTTVVREPVYVRQVSQPVVIRHAPPVVQEVRSPAPGPEFGWVQGHWAWQNNQWVWQTGHWFRGAVRPMPQVIIEQVTIASNPAQYWVPGHWFWRNGEWEWRKGHWGG